MPKPLLVPTGTSSLIEVWYYGTNISYQLFTLVCSCLDQNCIKGSQWRNKEWYTVLTGTLEYLLGDGTCLYHAGTVNGS